MADDKLHTYEDEMAAQARGETTEAEEDATITCRVCAGPTYQDEVSGSGACPDCAIHCDCCTDEITEGEGNEFNGDETWCATCFAEETFTCPECEERWHKDERADSGLCHECRDEFDRDLQSTIEDLIGDDKGHLVRAALVAAGLIEG